MEREPPHPVMHLAKFTPPMPGVVLARPRLFEWLDRSRAGRLIWISAPAGAGKTTLVSSWLHDRALDALWYRIDEGDADPAAFFAHMAEAAALVVPNAIDILPPLTPESALGLPVFTRHYFRALFRLLAPMPLLVLDDYHLLPSDAPLHEILRIGIEEVPPGSCVVVTSRIDPPAEFARLRAGNGCAMLDWQALRLNDEEAGAIVHLRRGAALPANLSLRRLIEQADGWAAGLVLLLEYGAGMDVSKSPRLGDAGLFDYFATEILRDAGAELHRFLLVTALLPEIGIDAATTLTGVPQAGEVLESLVRRNFFTVRYRRGGDVRYSYHPLFRAYLLDAATRHFSEGELATLKRHAAALMFDEGDVDAAMSLLLATQDWPTAIRHLLEQADALLRTGRQQTLAGWLAALPAACFDEQPWLSFLDGQCRMGGGPMLARGCFERAWEGFRRDDDVRGLYLAWAAIGDCILLNYDDFPAADPWLDRYEALRGQYPEFPDTDAEMRVLATAVSLLALRRPHHPALPEAARRLEGCLFDHPDPVRRLAAAGPLLMYLTWWHADPVAAKQLVDRLSPTAATCEQAPLSQLLWETWCAYRALVAVDIDACEAALERGLVISERSGIGVVDFRLRTQRIWRHVLRGDTDRAIEVLEERRPLASEVRGVDSMQYWFLMFQAMRLREDLPQMRFCVREMQRFGDVLGDHCIGTFTALSEALLLDAEGDRVGAAAGLAEAHELAERCGALSTLWEVLMVQAEFAADIGDAPAVSRLLREACALGSRHGICNGNAFGWRREGAAGLWAHALAEDIEPDYVRRMIRLHRLPPPAAAMSLEAWPWPVRISALGGFELQVDDQPLVQERREGKPLLLLKALIAFGGRDVPEERLCDALWPEAEGDAAHRSFDVNVHRLRKLLGHAGSLVLSGGRLSLDRSHCFLDLWVLEQWLDDVEALLPAGATPDEVRTLVDRLPDCARRGLLPGMAQDWAAAARDRLRTRLQRALERLEGYWAAIGDAAQVARCRSAKLAAAADRDL